MRSGRSAEREESVRRRGEVRFLAGRE